MIKEEQLFNSFIGGTSMTANSVMSQLLAIGNLFLTDGAKCTLNPEDIRSALRVHAAGQTGESWAEDYWLGDAPVFQPGEVFSAHRDRYGQRFYILTEADGRVTTVMLPIDY